MACANCRHCYMRGRKSYKEWRCGKAPDEPSAHNKITGEARALDEVYKACTWVVDKDKECAMFEAGDPLEPHVPLFRRLRGLLRGRE